MPSTSAEESDSVESAASSLRLSDSSESRRVTTATDVRVAMAVHRMTQTELGQALGGVSKATINNWANGVSDPPPYLWRALEHLTAELQAASS